MRLLQVKQLLALASEKKSVLKEKIFKGEVMLEADKARLTAINSIITNYTKLLNYSPEEEKEIMNENNEIKKQTIPLQKVTDQLGRIHVFKMIPRAEREFCIQAIAGETGALLTPAIMVTGALYDGKSAWNLGKKIAKFYDPDKERGFNNFKVYPDLIKAIENKHKGVIYLRGEWKKKIVTDKGAQGGPGVAACLEGYGSRNCRGVAKEASRMLRYKGMRFLLC